MYDTSAKNASVPVFLRIVTIVECVVVAAAAITLFFFPAIAKNIWVWDVPPFNARYVGAIYFAALLPLIIFALVARWSPGRVVLWMIFAFTTAIGVVMFMYIPKFEWTRLGTPIFWLLYIFLPFNSIFFLYKLRDWRVSDSEKTSPLIFNLLLAVTVLCGLYGLGLLLIPETVTAFWPWKIDDFHGRIYAATFLTPAMGAWIIRRDSARSEHLVLGLTLTTLGLLSTIGTVWASLGISPEKQINYANLGTWAFFGLNLLCILAGLGLIRSFQKR